MKNTSTYAVIFDLDGLLIDSEPLWGLVDKEFADKYHKKYTQEIKKEIMGTGQYEGAKLLKNEYNLTNSLDEIVQERRSMLYKKLFPKLSLMKGAREIIKRYHSRGLPLAIATGGFPQEKIKEIVEILHLSEFFIVLVSSDEVSQGKPHPDIYLHTAALLGVDPRNCLVLEDSPNGVKAAKAAGMVVFGVNNDISIQIFLKKAGAKSVFTSLSEVTV